jgi:hypothetical protein
MANAFGYAVPGAGGLPYRVHYGSHYYFSYLTCAGASWCIQEETAEQRAQPYCTPGALVRQELIESRSEPLARVGAVMTLFGPSHDIFTAGGLTPSQTATQLYIEAAQKDCYVVYGLRGGP